MLPAYSPKCLCFYCYSLCSLERTRTDGGQELFSARLGRALHSPAQGRGRHSSAARLVATSIAPAGARGRAMRNPFLVNRRRVSDGGERLWVECGEASERGASRGARIESSRRHGMNKACRGNSTYTRISRDGAKLQRMMQRTMARAK